MGTEYTGDAEHCTVCVPSRSTCRGVASHGGGNSPVHSPHEQLRHEAVGRIAAEVPRHASRPTKECEAATMPFASQRRLFSNCRLVRPAAHRRVNLRSMCNRAAWFFIRRVHVCAQEPPSCMRVQLHHVQSLESFFGPLACRGRAVRTTREQASRVPEVLLLLLFRSCH